MDKTLPAPSRGGNPYLTPAAAAERTFAPAPNASSSSRAGAPQIPTPKAATTAPPLRPIPLPPRPTPSPAHHLKSHRAPRPPEARTPPVLPQYRGNGVAFGSSSWDRPPTHVSPTRILKNPAAAQPPNTATTQLRPSGGTTPSGDRDKQTTTNGLEARQNQTSGSRPITAATAPKPASVSNGNPARIPSPATRPPTTPTPKPTAPQVVRQNPKTPQQTEHTGAPPERKLRSNHPVPISDATANLHPKGTELEDGEGKQDFWIPMTEKECQQYSIKLGAVYNAFSQAVNPEVGLLAGYRVPDDGGPPVPYLVEEIAKAKDESVLQLLMTKVEEALESAKGKKTQYSSELPRGYKWFKFLFRPSYTKTGNPEEVHGKGRHLNIKNTLYRYDPYLLGHPAGKSVKFRSFNEFKPHLVWLLYANYRCKRNEPQSEEEWDARNLVNCICDYCGGYIARVVREVYWPLTRPMQYFIDAKKFDVMGPSAVFRVRERVWARVVLQEDGTISAGFSTFSTAFVKWVGRTGGYFPSQVLEGELVSIWPCEILKRTVGPDEELNAIAARMQSGAVGAQRRLAITSGAAEPVQASSNTESLSNESVIYTVRLLGVPKELHDGVLAPTTTFRSTQLFPYLLEKSAAQSKLVLPRGIQPDSAIRFREWHKAGLKEIGESAKQWRVPEKSDAGDYLRAFAFGNEVVRLGDFVRLKPAGGRLIEQAFSITRIIIDKEKKNLRLLGVRWEVQPEFAISLKDYGTRIPYWKPMNDVSGRHGDVVEKPLKEIAGRWYPVNSNATLVHNIKAGTYWYGWEALENRQVNMEVQLEGKPIDLASFDDSDVIKNNKAAALLMSSRRSRLMIQGTTEVPAPAAAADKKIPSETPSTKKRHASSAEHPASVPKKAKPDPDPKFKRPISASSSRKHSLESHEELRRSERLVVLASLSEEAEAKKRRLAESPTFEPAQPTKKAPRPSFSSVPQPTSTGIRADPASLRAPQSSSPKLRTNPAPHPTAPRAAEILPQTGTAPARSPDGQNHDQRSVAKPFVPRAPSPDIHFDIMPPAQVVLPERPATVAPTVVPAATVAPIVVPTVTSSHAALRPIPARKTSRGIGLSTDFKPPRYPAYGEMIVATAPTTSSVLSNQAAAANPPPAGASVTQSLVCGLEGCERTYRTLADLTRHQKTKVKTCEFPGCGYRAHRTETMNRHKTSTHGGNKRRSQGGDDLRSDTQSLFSSLPTSKRSSVSSVVPREPEESSNPPALPKPPPPPAAATAAAPAPPASSRIEEVLALLARLAPPLPPPLRTLQVGAGAPAVTAGGVDAWRVIPLGCGAAAANAATAMVTAVVGTVAENGAMAAVAGDERCRAALRRAAVMPPRVVLEGDRGTAGGGGKEVEEGDGGLTAAAAAVEVALGRMRSFSSTSK